jgi:hypothetical protein
VIQVDGQLRDGGVGELERVVAGLGVVSVNSHPEVAVISRGGSACGVY